MFATAVVAMLVAAPPELSDAAKKELKALEGDWKVVALASDGMERDLPEAERVAVTIKGAKFTFGKLGAGQVTALDPSLKPKIVDFVMLRKPASDHTNEAIYKLEQDTLTVVLYVGEDKKRPSSFDVPKDQKTVRFILKRGK